MSADGTSTKNIKIDVRDLAAGWARQFERQELQLELFRKHNTQMRGLLKDIQFYLSGDEHQLKLAYDRISRLFKEMEKDDHEFLTRNFKFSDQ